jgi:SAM-dependent methyltransferase
MKRETIEALDGLNRLFYTAQGEEFSATRRTPWPAWNRVVESFISSRATEHAGHSILDVGCGNGRLASLLEEALDAGWSYLGIDASLILAREARTGGGHDRRLVLADVVHGALPFALQSELFDLIAVFGVLHHIPSWERRRSLLVELAGYLRSGGVLAVSFWQFGADSRFEGRVVDWGEYNSAAATPIPLEDLESGDHLLRWGSGAALRYCHFANLAEAAEVTAATGLERLETFRGDGASGELNLYHLMRKRLHG